MIRAGKCGITENPSLFKRAAVRTMSSIGVPSICAMYTRVFAGRRSRKSATFSAVRGMTSIEKSCRNISTSGVSRPETGPVSDLNLSNAMVSAPCFGTVAVGLNGQAQPSFAISDLIRSLSYSASRRSASAATISAGSPATS